MTARGGWRMWLAAAAGGAALVGVMALFVLMIAAPDTKLARLDERSERIGAALRDLLRKAKPASGDYTDADTRAIDRVADGYEFRARVTGTALLIVARGNLDDDEALDDWQISSIDPVPLHLYDDARNLWVDSALPAIFEVPTTGLNPDIPPADRVRIPSTIAAWKRSRQAKVVLEDLARDEARHFHEKGSYVAFEALTPAVWRELADTSSGRMSLVVRARVSGTSVLLTAVGNVDADPCLDVWAMKPGDLVPEHLQDDVVLDECEAQAPAP